MRIEIKGVHEQCTDYAHSLEVEFDASDPEYVYVEVGSAKTCVRRLDLVAALRSLGGAS